MQPMPNNKKVWAKPVVQMLNINSDTYSNPVQGAREVGQGGGNNQNKALPS